MSNTGPTEVTPGRLQTLETHRPDLALWLEAQRAASGAGEFTPKQRADFAETFAQDDYQWLESAEELRRALSAMTQDGGLPQGCDSIRPTGRV